MDDLIINENGFIVYKNIVTDYTCENIFNILSNNEDVSLVDILNKEIIVDFRDKKINFGTRNFALEPAMSREEGIFTDGSTSLVTWMRSMT